MSFTVQAEDVDDGDELLCACCRDGSVYDDNEILLCDSCNVSVHQTCYGIKVIPKGNW